MKSCSKNESTAIEREAVLSALAKLPTHALGEAGSISPPTSVFDASKPSERGEAPTPSDARSSPARWHAKRVHDLRLTDARRGSLIRIALRKVWDKVRDDDAFRAKLEAKIGAPIFGHEAANESSLAPQRAIASAKERVVGLRRFLEQFATLGASCESLDAAVEDLAEVTGLLDRTGSVLASTLDASETRVVRDTHASVAAPRRGAMAMIAPDARGSEFGTSTIARRESSARGQSSRHRQHDCGRDSATS